jgi:delta-1-pyrroline-5-carboxylate synthetase
MIHDNDALAAYLATEINADLLVLISNVDGVYNKPPGSEDSRILYTFTPKEMQSQNQSGTIEFGSKSSIGLGGMESKVSSALWALERGTSVVICNGDQKNVITSILEGKKIGTFFTLKNSCSVNVEELADKGK